MFENGKIWMIPAVLCGVIGILILWGTGQKDKEKPVITYEKQALYYDGVNADSLLQGVTATDNRDGDVSDTLIVSGIFSTSGETGVVVYAAKDSSNNVAARSRGFFYDGVTAQDFLAGQGNGNPVQMPPEDEEGQDALTGDENQEAGEAGEGEDTQIPATDEPLGVAQMTDQQYEEYKAAQLAQGIPVLRLVKYEDTLARGSDFNVYAYIDELVDDEDSINTMLRVDGTVNGNQPGTYEVTLYGRDSDGNLSNEEE